MCFEFGDEILYLGNGAGDNRHSILCCYARVCCIAAVIEQLHVKIL